MLQFEQKMLDANRGKIRYFYRCYKDAVMKRKRSQPQLAASSLSTVSSSNDLLYILNNHNSRRMQLELTVVSQNHKLTCFNKQKDPTVYGLYSFAKYFSATRLCHFSYQQHDKRSVTTLI